MSPSVQGSLSVFKMYVKRVTFQKKKVFEKYLEMFEKMGL